MASKGFIELLKLNDRGITRARDRLGESERLWSGVAFRLGDISLIAPLGEVSEVVNMLQGSNVPMVQTWMKGVANLRGRLLPLVDLSEFTGITEEAKRSSKHKIIVIDQPNLFSGLIVDQVFGIQHFSANQYIGESLQVNEGINSYLQGYFKRDNNTVWHVFMLSKLAKDERYLDAAV